MNTKLEGASTKAGKYRRRNKEDPTARVTISMSQKEKDAFQREADNRGISFSGMILISAMGNLELNVNRLVTNLMFTAEDLEFMLSIVKAVGVPLTLEELLSLLQKHKSREP